MSKEKTHFRKAFDSPYLSSADIVEPTVLTVKHVRLEKNLTRKTKDLFNTAHFVETELRKGEKLKPMILNATNSKIMKDLAGTPFIDDWQNIPITVYVDSNVKFGRETVDGLRIRPERAVLKKPTLKKGTPQWKNAIIAYKRDGNLDAVRKRMEIPEDTAEQLKKEAKDVA